MKNSTPRKSSTAKSGESKSKKQTLVSEKEEKALAKELAKTIKDKPVRKAPARKSKKAKQQAIQPLSGVDLAMVVAQGMFEKKAENIRILDMRHVKGASADFFVIAHATNDKQVEAVANSAEDEVLKQTGERPMSREGYENLEWVLLDYFDVVAHVFLEEKRHFYGVEELWGDATEISFKGK